VSDPLVIIKSPPGSDGAIEAVRVARDNVADIVLVEEAVLLARKDKLEGFCGTVYALRDDILSRGIDDLEKGVKEIDAGELEDLLSDKESIIGIY